jgi:ATP-dependent RNA helicase DDX18/HAS1
MQLALVPKSNCSDPPTNDCSHATTEFSTKESAVSSLYSSSVSSSEQFSDKGTQLDTIESETESESEEDTYTKESEFTPKVGQELVVRKESETTNSDEYALVEYEESTAQDDEEDGGVIVPAKSRYLAAAVDNDGAMVPLNSDVYEAYDHTFVSCPEHLRFRLLYTFLKKNRDKKIIIFYSTTDEVLFHSKLLRSFKIPVSIMHSLQERDRFINTFLKFSDSGEGVLCTTDESGRDLDIPPSVDYVLQFDAPDDPSEYIMRIGRISCDSDRVGRSILFLNPGETGFLKYYDAASIPVIEFEIPRLADIQSSVESRVNEDERMLQLAKNAYGSYLLAYASHGFRDVYNVHDLNKDDVAAAFGLVSNPSGDDDDDTYYAGQNARSTKNNRRKPKQDWMRGKKKMWPHCKVKLHPKVHPSFNKNKSQDTDSQLESESLDA